MTYDSRAEDHITVFPRPSPSIFGYSKRSKTGGIEGLGMRLQLPPWFSKIISNQKYPKGEDKTQGMMKGELDLPGNIAPATRSGVSTQYMYNKEW